MLVLALEDENDSIVIGDNEIRIRYLGKNGHGRHKLGFENIDPNKPEISVNRAKIYERIVNEGTQNKLVGTKK